MAKRRDNMLEAFRASAEAEQRARELREAAAADDARRAKARAAASKPNSNRSSIDAPVLQPKRAQAARNRSAAQAPAAGSAQRAGGHAPSVATQGARTAAGGSAPQAPAPRAPQPSQTSPTTGRSSGAPPPSAPQPLAPVGPATATEVEDGLVLPVGGITFLTVLVALLGLSFALGWLAGRGPQDGSLGTLSDAGESELRTGNSASLGMPNTRGGWEGDSSNNSDRTAGIGGSNPGGNQGVSVGSLPAPDRALADPTNKYTVMALTQKDDSRGADLMRLAREYLLDQQFPVARPIQHKGKLLLFVGAAEHVMDLQDLQRRLVSLQGPKGEDQYLRGPYTVSIDTYQVPARPSSAGALGPQR